MNGIKLSLRDRISKKLYDIWNGMGTRYGWHSKRLKEVLPMKDNTNMGSQKSKSSQNIFNELGKRRGRS